jgi:hypothetical protein
MIYQTAGNAELRRAIGRTLAELDACVEALATHFPKPRLVRMKRGVMGRHEDKAKTDLLASHLKCIRAVSALNSALALADLGQIQDVYALCRIADEQQEDIVFLATPLGEKGGPSADQIRFVQEFYQEELDDDLPLLSATKERDRVPRRKVRAATARIPVPDGNPSDIGAVTGMIYNSFSGFVHGAYVHILEQYDGTQYRTRPSDHPRSGECLEMLASYVYRACLGAFAVARRCNDTAIAARVDAACNALSTASGCVPTKEELELMRARVKKPPSSNG